MENKNSSRTQNSSAIICQSGCAGNHEVSKHWRRFVPAWIVSAMVHVILLAAILLVSVSSAEPARWELAMWQADLEENTRPPDFEVADIGPDPLRQTNRDVDRVDVETLFNKVHADEHLGIDTPLPAAPGWFPPVSSAGNNDIVVCPAPPIKPFGFRGLSGATRARMLEAIGGTSASEAAVASGLQWLALHQYPDGRWSLTKFCQAGKCNCTGAGRVDNDVAATAFALLPFLGTGQTHKTGADKGNRYVKEVERGLRYLILRQNREGELHPNMYAHGLATIAVCEAYGMTSDPALRGPAQRALNYIVEAQSQEGGWRYASCHRGPGGYDGSICAWQLMALKSGQMAGLDVPNQTLKGATQWLDAAQTQDGAAYGYTSPGNGPATSAAGLLCRQYLGWGSRMPALRNGLNDLHNIGPQPAYMYYSYYATQVMHHMGGTDWERWNPMMRDGLIAAQDRGDKNPHQKGSWYDARDGISSGQGGRIMQTSLSLLTLEVYYRHLPLYRRNYNMQK